MKGLKIFLQQLNFQTSQLPSAVITVLLSKNYQLILQIQQILTIQMMFTQIL